MDVDSERIVQQRLGPAARNKTLILITHRLSMLRIVDRLIVMDGGRIIMDGPRDVVLRKLQEKQGRKAPDSGSRRETRGKRRRGNEGTCAKTRAPADGSRKRAAFLAKRDL